MKHLLTFFALLMIIRADAFSSDGKITALTPGTFQIAYADQVINLYFNYLPRGDFEQKVSSEVLFEAEKQITVRNLRDGIDLLPDQFISDFLDVDVHFLHILDENTFGYYFDNQIILEIDNLKLEFAGQHPIASLFMNQLAHRLAEQMKNRDELMVLMDFLDDFHREKHCVNNVTIEDAHRCGYVSSRTSSIGIGHYHPVDEFAELFANLVIPEKRNNILEYIHNHPGSALEEKIGIFINYLEDMIPSMNRRYFRMENPLTARTKTSVDESGEALLISHENRSGEGSFADSPGYVEETAVDLEKHVGLPTEPVLMNETDDDDIYVSGLSTDKAEQDLAQREQQIREKNKIQERQQNQKKKKRRRKAIIWSTVAIVLLALI